MRKHPGARNCTLTSSTSWPKTNCPNAPTTKRRIASSSKRGGKRRTTNAKGQGAPYTLTRLGLILEREPWAVPDSLRCLGYFLSGIRPLRIDLEQLSMTTDPCLHRIVAAQPLGRLIGES